MIYCRTTVALTRGEIQVLGKLCSWPVAGVTGILPVNGLPVYRRSDPSSFYNGDNQEILRSSVDMIVGMCVHLRVLTSSPYRLADNQFNERGRLSEQKIPILHFSVFRRHDYIRKFRTFLYCSCLQVRPLRVSKRPYEVSCSSHAREQCSHSSNPAGSTFNTGVRVRWAKWRLPTA